MRTTSLIGVLLVAAAVAPLGAQDREDELTFDRPIRGWAGGQLYYARPVGDFSRFIDHGWGGAAHGTLLLDQAGAIGLRFDASFMNYGRERVPDICLTQTNCRVTVDVVTTNNIAFFGGGPQLMAPRGVVRPYVAGQLGWTFIWTDSSIEDSDDYERTTLDSQNIADNTFSYGGLGGLLIPVSGGRNPAMIDLGVRYLRNGSVRYLREGDIVDNVSGAPYLNVQRSRADLLTYYVGITVGLR